MDDTAVTGRLGLQYDLAPRVMAYAQYSRGYKAGGFSQSTCDNAYKPENLDAGELGLKSRFLENRLALNAATFYYNYRNIQLERASPAGIPVVNAPRAHVLGLDLDLVFIPTEGWRIGAAVSAIDSRYDEFINSDPLLGVLPGVSLAGVHLNNAPALSATFSLERRLQLATLGSLTLRGEVYTTTNYNLPEWLQDLGLGRDLPNAGRAFSCPRVREERHKRDDPRRRARLRRGSGLVPTTANLWSGTWRRFLTIRSVPRRLLPLIGGVTIKRRPWLAI